MFENDVKAEGTKPDCIESDIITRFENDVKAEGTKLAPFRYIPTHCLRMM